MFDMTDQSLKYTIIAKHINPNTTKAPVRVTTMIITAVATKITSY